MAGRSPGAPAPISATVLLTLLTTVVRSCLLEDGRSAVYLSVFEDLKPGEIVGTLPIRANLGEMSLRVVRGGEFVDLAQDSKDLLLKKELDRDEGSTKFDALVECSMNDSSSDFNRLNISVVVLVKDVNDNAPIFDKAEYAADVAEELPIGTVVFAGFEATDADQSGANSLVHYSIVDEGEFGGLLHVEDPEKPLVSVRKRMDYEAPLHSFTVLIEARDNGTPQQVTRAPLHITVKDMDDLPAVFNAERYTAKLISANELVVVPPLSARDGDALNTPVRYELLGENAADFSIGSDGTIKVTASPAPTYATLLIHAYQVDRMDRNATAFLVVDLLPTLTFEHDRYTVQVQPDTPPNTMIAHAKAVSRNEQGRVRYSIEEGSDAVVAVDDKYGKIFYKGSEKAGRQRGTISYTILANDGKQVARAGLSLQLSPEGACSVGLKFERETYEMQIQGKNPQIGEISLESGNLQEAALKLHNMNSYFTIDANGRLALAPSSPPPCDFCELIISASDSSGRTAVTKVIVHNLSPALSTMALLCIVQLIVIVVLLCLLTLFICRRMSYAYVINTDKSASSTCSKSSSPSTALPTSPSTRVSAYRNTSGNVATGARLVPVTVTSTDGAPTVYF